MSRIREYHKITDTFLVVFRVWTCLGCDVKMTSFGTQLNSYLKKVMTDEDNLQVVDMTLIRLFFVQSIHVLLFLWLC